MIRSFGDRATFADLRVRGRRARRGSVSVVYAEVGPPGEVRIAFAIGRRVGNAVVRNRIRRRLRAVLGELDRAGGLVPGSYLVTAGASAATVSFPVLTSDLAAALDGAVRRWA